MGGKEREREERERVGGKERVGGRGEVGGGRSEGVYRGWVYGGGVCCGGEPKVFKLYTHV